MKPLPLLLLVLLSGCGKHEKPRVKNTGTTTASLTPICPTGHTCTLDPDGTVAVDNTWESPAPETAFQRDYAVLRPQVDECEKYAHAEDMDHLRECYVRVAPLANKVAAEANADETITANTIEVELLALDDDVLAFQIRQQMDEIDKRVKKLSHNRERPSRISP